MGKRLAAALLATNILAGYGQLKPAAQESEIKNEAVKFALSAGSSHSLNDIVGLLSSSEFRASIASQNLTEIASSYSRKVAESSPDFSKGVVWAKEYITDAIDARQHSFREGARYSERSSELRKIKDVHLLFVLKELVDYFNSEDASILASGVFPNGKAAREEGGLFFMTANGLEPLHIPNVASQMGLDEDVKYVRNILPFPSIGLFHTHTANKHPYWAVSGPAFDSSSHAWWVTPDFIDASVAQKANPYTINVILIRMGNCNYNVDFYFSDVETDREGKLKATGLPVVIDAGIFTYDCRIAR